MRTVLRLGAAIFIGCASWLALVTTALIALRVAWPAYAAVERSMQFDEPMMAARLGASALASLLAGWLTAMTMRDARIAPLAGGLVLLAVFIPIHIMLWDKFPVWYHLTFLTSLPLLALLGGALGARGHRAST